MAGVLCSMVGATFAVATAQVIRSKKSIVAVGNAQVDTAQSQFGGASALFDGTGDGLFVRESTNFAYGTGDFTIECWARFNSLAPTFSVLVDQRTGDDQAPFLQMNGSTLQYGKGFNNYIVHSSLVTNTWYHIAVSRSGTSTRMFVNGTQVGSTYTDTNNYTSAVPRIGIAFNDTASLNGWIDELRISNTARYTSNFTSSTTPFVNDDNTLLLLHMNGTDASTYFEDDNGQRASRGLTAIGNAQVDTAQSRFGGASMLFDGTGDHIRAYSVGNSASGDFTFEGWIRPANTGTNYHIMSLTGNSGRWGLTVYQNGTTVRVYASSGSSTWNVFNGISIGTVAANTWYHVAVVRSGSTWYGFVNGAATTIGTSSATLDTSGDVDIGAFVSTGGGIESFNGWIDEVRVSNIPRYTSAFTAPTAPFQNDANTLLLVHGDGTDASTVFTDDNGYHTTGRVQKHVYPVGNAQIDTAQSKFSGSSALFDGTGDYLRINETSAFAYGTGAFTIEFWIRFNSTTAKVIWDQRASGLNGAYPTIYWASSTIRYLANGADRITSSTLSTGVWYHVAVSRSGTETKMFINGTQAGSTYSDSTNYITGTPIVIAADSNNLGVTALDGWMDEIRVSNVARYTSNFTEPTAPFVDDANTLLLMHMDSVDASTTFVDDAGGRPQVAITAFGNAQIDNAQSQFGGTSALFDGNGDYLLTQLNVVDDFTFECWARPSNVSGEKYVFRVHDSSDNFQYVLGILNTSLYVFSGGTTSGGTLAANTWYHIAFVRDSSNNLNLYLNGTNVATRAVTTDLPNARIYIGGYTATLGMAGHLDEIRISNTARYTANFTPSTTPFVNDANTQLLIHADGTDASTVFRDDNGKIPYTP